MPRTKKTTTASNSPKNIPTVPAAEQPYKVPENWRWVRLGEIYVINPPVEGDDSMDVSFVPMEKVNPGMCSDFTFDILPWKQAKKGHTRFANGDIAFAKISPCFENRKAFIATGLLNGIGGGTTELIILRHPKILQKYTYYSIMADRFINGGVQTYSGTVGQQRISMDYVRNYPFPLPPLAEQQRIVDRIERLFAKLDEAREKAQAVVDGFENRKAAILHKAFTGELTRKWREERGIGMTNWQKYTIQELCDKITCGKTPKEHITAIGDIPFLKVYNIVNNKIDFESVPQFIPEAIHSNKLSSSILRPNDVIMNIVGPPLRKVAIIPNTYPEWNMNQAIVRFRPDNRLSYKFLYYYLINPETLDKIIPETRGVVGQVNISVSQSRNLIIVLPKLIEQIEIVKSLDTIFTQERRARDLAESVIAQIDGMKKSILARAFRGELGTNDPSEAACEV